MAITLAALPEGSLVMKAVVLALVAVGITGAVYGAVALIVKADDIGLVLVGNGSALAFGGFARAFGRRLVVGMPVFLRILGVVGTAAMVWVGGGIIVHGLQEYRFPVLGNAIHHAAEIAGKALPPVGSVVEWMVTAAGSGIVGLVVGAAMISLTDFLLVPAWKQGRTMITRKRS